MSQIHFHTGAEGRGTRPGRLLRRTALLLAALLLASLFMTPQIAPGLSQRASANGVEEETDLYRAIQQTAYSYYMRGHWIQYNSNKGNPTYASPEEATEQNMNYTVCSSFVKNVYYDLLGGIKIPQYTSSQLDYAERYVGNPEVVMFGERKNGKNIMYVYDEASGGAVEHINMTTDELLPFLRIGDILTYTGHTMLVYDLMYDGDGNVVNARVIESGHGGYAYVVTKIAPTTSIASLKYGSSNHQLYLADRENTSYEDCRSEGSLHLSTLKDVTCWKELSASSKKRYSVLRFLTEEDGKIKLTYHGADYSEADYDGVVIDLPEKSLDRLKYANLFIEKTIDVSDGTYVEIGDVLTYRIRVVNESGEAYSDDITVTENLSPFLEYESYSSSKAAAFSANEEDGSIAWNIGALKSGEEVIVTYKALVAHGSAGDVIESTGTVEHIPSASLKNTISRGLSDEEYEAIAGEYERLKDRFSGKELINEIYIEATGQDLGIADFNIQSLIKNSNISSNGSATISLDPESPFFGAVLNPYWSALAQTQREYNTKELYTYDFKNWRRYTNTLRRADTVYEENFRTGDVLIYTNSHDVLYRYDSLNDLAVEVPVTYEDGEYAYIFIEGRGFVGVNLGADGVPGTPDDRNSFTKDYYSENGLSLLSVEEERDERQLDFANYQTLFGKDYYVILRPSLLFSESPGESETVEAPAEDGADNEGIAEDEESSPAPDPGGTDTDDSASSLTRSGHVIRYALASAAVLLVVLLVCFRRARKS